MLLLQLRRLLLLKLMQLRWSSYCDVHVLLSGYRVVVLETNWANFALCWGAKLLVKLWLNFPQYTDPHTRDSSYYQRAHWLERSLISNPQLLSCHDVSLAGNFARFPPSTTDQSLYRTPPIHGTQIRHHTENPRLHSSHRILLKRNFFHQKKFTFPIANFQVSSHPIAVGGYGQQQHKPLFQGTLHDTFFEGTPKDTPGTTGHTRQCCALSRNSPKNSQPAANPAPKVNRPTQSAVAHWGQPCPTSQVLSQPRQRVVLTLTRTCTESTKLRSSVPTGTLGCTTWEEVHSAGTLTVS